MNSLNLIYILKTVLILEKTICSETEDIPCTDDAALGLILMQNSAEENEVLKEENDVVDEKVFEKDSFFNLMKSAREMFKKVEEEKERTVCFKKNGYCFLPVYFCRKT